MESVEGDYFSALSNIQYEATFTKNKQFIVETE